jgi:hypothetical protein
MTDGTTDQKFGRLVEVCGKVLADVGQTLSQESGGPNPASWLRELKLAIRSVEDAIDPTNRCVVCGESMGAEHECPEREGAGRLADIGAWLWREVAGNTGKPNPEIGSFWRDTAQSIYRLGQSAGRIEMRKTMTNSRPVGDKPVRRTWRQLPKPYNGKPMWTLRDDSSRTGPGVIFWDSHGEPAAWSPLHEDAEIARSLVEAMAQVERYLGVVGAVRPSIEVKPDKPWPTAAAAAAAEPKVQKSSGLDAAEGVFLGRDPDQQAVFERSGQVASDDPLVGFLYLLMRDSVPVGMVAKLARELKPPMTFTNGWLAEYAKDVAGRLRDADLEALGRLERTVLTAERTVLREALQAIVAARIIPDGKKSVPIERLTEAVDRAAALLNRG